MTNPPNSYLYQVDLRRGRTAVESSGGKFNEIHFRDTWMMGYVRGKGIENEENVAPLKLLLWDVDTYLGMLIDRGVPNGGDIASLRERIGKLVPK